MKIQSKETVYAFTLEEIKKLLIGAVESKENEKVDVEYVLVSSGAEYGGYPTYSVNEIKVKVSQK